MSIPAGVLDHDDLTQRGFGITTIVLVVGIFKSKKGLLVPFIVAQTVMIGVFVALVVILVVNLANGNNIYYFDILTLWANELGGDPIFIYRAVYWPLVALLACAVILELGCLLCVVSQYQELRDGRGTGPLPMTTTTTVVMVPQGSYVNQGGDTGGEPGTTPNTEEQATTSTGGGRKKPARAGKSSGDGPSGASPPKPDHSSSSESESDHD
ncbi:uncharacterized protein LOC119744275 [Patiria miniata]|uniref:Uncharacterized protein n=1 Tax=Patiria miniata TaxID=46514 RepID=A0A914BKS9_PATMI|nr:uncharacterized protein LOC119744275 [Patiria miniata]